MRDLSDDQMQRDTDAGMFAFMQQHATDEEWTRFATILLVS